jgi:hypothetical protein
MRFCAVSVTFGDAAVARGPRASRTAMHIFEEMKGMA